MNHRSRFFRYGLLSSIGALVVGIGFFTGSAQKAHGDTGCSDCYVVTPATNPATAGAGTGEVYAFQVTNNDPHEYLVSLTFSAPTDFVITDATGPSGTTVSALPDSSVTLDLPIEPTGSTFTVDVTALAPCVPAKLSGRACPASTAEGKPTRSNGVPQHRSACRSPGSAA